MAHIGKRVVVGLAVFYVVWVLLCLWLLLLSPWSAKTLSHVGDVATVIVVFAVAVLKGGLWLVPWSARDWRLRVSLSFYSFAFAALWGSALLRILGVLHGPSPEWFNWSLRVLLTVFGVSAIVEMIRASRKQRGR